MRHPNARRPHGGTAGHHPHRVSAGGLASVTNRQCASISTSGTSSATCRMICPSPVGRVVVGVAIASYRAYPITSVQPVSVAQGYRLVLP